MRDSEVVAAIVAGDPGGLAEAYDRYAAPLYAYCRSLLREPADAADVVQDTFLIAASRLAGLRDQNRLRPWLYAVARNECYRRMRATAADATAPLDTMPDVTDAGADVSGEVGRAELRALLRSAVRGLSTSDQDLIELQMRQGLGAAEIAAMLGVSRNQAHALLSRARNRLEASLGALLVARAGRQDCGALSALLQSWDGQLTVLTRKRINRHIERCPVCAERKRREMAPALLLGLAPLAALPIAAMPAGLRAQVLKLASSNTPEAVAHRGIVAQRTAAFGHNGFPKPLDPPKSPWWRSWRGHATAGGAAAAAVAATVIGVALAGGSPGRHADQAALAHGAVPGSGFGAVSGSRARTQGQPQATGPAGGAGPSSPAPVVAGPPSPATGGAVGAVGPTGVAGSGTGSGSGSPRASRSARSSTPPSPGLTQAPEPSSGATIGPNSSGSSTAPASGTAAPASSTPPPPPPSPGTLDVSSTSILLSVGSSATLTLTASNGPVNWSITASQGLVGGLTISPSSGTLASGSSTTVTVTASDLLTVGGQLTVQPGGITVSVVLSLNLGALAPGPGGSGPGGSPVVAGLSARHGAW